MTKVVKYPVFWGGLVLIGILHLVGMFWNLYAVMPWYDILMHFLGGLWVGLVYLKWIYRNSDLAITGKTALETILFVFIIGILWELFEILLNITLGARYAYLFLAGNATDTVGDLIWDIIGAITSSVVAHRAKKKGVKPPFVRKKPQRRPH